MELDLPDHAKALYNAIFSLAKSIGNASDETKQSFTQMINELNLLFSPVAHPFFDNLTFSEMFTDWKSMYMRTKEMLPEQQKINVMLLVKLSKNDVERATSILENAIRYKFLDLSKSSEKMPEVILRSSPNIPLQPKMAVFKAPELCQNPEEVLAAHKFTISGRNIRCETVPAERAILLRSQLSGYKVIFTQNP